MATYAIGDIQGCYQTLQALLHRCGFDPEVDRLWLVGDLVNRGPRSLEVLRWARHLDDRIVAVLGNHDLHLLGRVLGLRHPRKSDTLDTILEAPDCQDLIAWLRRRPLLHRHGSFVMVHAGLLPEWTVEEAESLARQAEAALQGEGLHEALASLKEPAPLRWSPELEDSQRLRVALRAFTRLRMLSRGGLDCEDFSGPPDEAPSGCVAWFDVPNRRCQGVTVVSGHWAALGLRIQPGLMALDSACVWGGELSAVRLEDGEVFQEPLAD